MATEDRIITTYTGLKVSINKCKRIKNEYYKVGDTTVKDSGECYLVERKYHRFNNGFIEYDHELRRYVIIHKTHLRYGIVDVKDEEAIFGHYSPNLTENVSLMGFIHPDKKSKSISTNCINSNLANKLNYMEKLSDGNFYHKDEMKASDFNKIIKSSVNKRNLPYDSRFNSNINVQQFDKFYNPKFDNTILNMLGDFLDEHGITFGVEFETTTGGVVERICSKYGLVALRDGSIEGLEYVTIPYSGRKGLYALRGVCNELKKRTKFNYTCALHMHLAGVKREPGALLAMFNLGYLVQNEMYSMQPAYKSGGKGIKNKDYCGPLPNNLYRLLDEKITKSNEVVEFKKLFEWASDGVPFIKFGNKLSNVSSHPSDPSGERKWNIGSRYKWLNFVPIIFTNKKTMEFRQHTSSFNFEVIINFLFMNACLIKLVNYEEAALIDRSSKLYKSLVDAPNNTVSTVMKKLVKHCPQIKELVKRNGIYNIIRKDIMKSMTEKGDIAGENEFRYDKLYSEKLKPEFWL